MESDTLQANPDLNVPASNDLILNNKALRSLNEAGNWTLFFSILGFLGIGLILILALLMPVIFGMLGSEVTQDFPGFIFGLIYFAMAAVYFFPVLFLYQFSVRVRKSIQVRDTELLGWSLHRLMLHFKVLGICTIALIVLYLLILIFGIGSSLMSL